jgi:hypothetical protein
MVKFTGRALSDSSERVNRKEGIIRDLVSLKQRTNEKISEVRRSGSNFPSPLKILAGSFPSDSVYKRKLERKEQMGAFSSPGNIRPVGTGPPLVKSASVEKALSNGGRQSARTDSGGTVPVSSGSQPVFRPQPVGWPQPDFNLPPPGFSIGKPAPPLCGIGQPGLLPAPPSIPGGEFQPSVIPSMQLGPVPIWNSSVLNPGTTLAPASMPLFATPQQQLEVPILGWPRAQFPDEEAVRRHPPAQNNVRGGGLSLLRDTRRCRGLGLTSRSYQGKSKIVLRFVRKCQGIGVSRKYPDRSEIIANETGNETSNSDLLSVRCSQEKTPVQLSQCLSSLRANHSLCPNSLRPMAGSTNCGTQTMFEGTRGPGHQSLASPALLHGLLHVLRLQGEGEALISSVNRRVTSPENV